MDLEVTAGEEEVLVEAAVVAEEVVEVPVAIDKI